MTRRSDQETEHRATAILVSETDDWAAALRLGLAAGLEHSGRETDGLVVLLGAYLGDEMVGAASLRRWKGLDIIGWMAVAGHLRGQGVGRRLLAGIECEARRRGATELWAAARAPGFYAAAGYADGGGAYERDVLIASCLVCPQYGRECSPRLMVKRLVAERPDCEPNQCFADGPARPDRG